VTDEQLTETVVAGPDISTPEDRAKARRNAIIRTLLVGGYLFVVFGILLPRIVSYSDVIDAFRAAPPQALLIVALIGILSWVSEGMAINAILPMLGIWRATVTWLSMTAVGSTIPGPVKMAFGYRLYRNWGLSAETAALGLSLNGLATQASKLILPAIATLFLTLAGVLPSWGYLVAILISLPVALGSLVGIWVLRSEDFARRVGAFATRTTDAVMRRVGRPEPDDLTPRLMGFRESARVMLLARLVPTVLSQLVARSMGYVLLLASLRAVGVPTEILPPEIVLGVYAAVMTITLLPIAPGGAGLPELLYITFFTSIVGDPSWDDAIAAGVMLYRGMAWFVPIPVGYLVLWVARQREKRQAAATAAETADPSLERPSA
jgi:uncharacterized protein (TIRG00374 family)